MKENSCKVPFSGKILSNETILLSKKANIALLYSLSNCIFPTTLALDLLCLGVLFKNATKILIGSGSWAKNREKPLGVYSLTLGREGTIALAHYFFYATCLQGRWRNLVNALLGMTNNFIQSAAEGLGSRYRSFPSKDDRMYYFIRHMVIVFNTNLKKKNEWIHTLGRKERLSRSADFHMKFMKFRHGEQFHTTTWIHTLGRKERLSRPADLHMKFMKFRHGEQFHTISGWRFGITLSFLS